MTKNRQATPEERVKLARQLERAAIAASTDAEAVDLRMHAARLRDEATEQRQARERVELLDDLLYDLGNGRPIPWTKEELLRMDIAALRRSYAAVFPDKHPSRATATVSFEVRSIMDGPPGASILDE